MAACNEQIELGIPLNEKLICQHQVHQRSSSLSQDGKVWFFYGVVGGAMVQLASFGMAFLFIGYSSTILTCAMISIYLCIVALWLRIFRFVETILRHENPNRGNEENECKPSNDTVSNLGNAFLYGIMGGGLIITACMHFLRR